jgi:phosphohistidine phosphatase
MKTIYLLRHAHSAQSLYSVKDWERPLSSKGIKASHKVFEAIKNKRIYPDKIISSPAFRAINTALLFAHDIGYPFEGVLINPLLYDGNSKSMIAFLRKQSDDINSIMLVGHNPSLARLYASLTGHTYWLPKSSVSIIKFKVDSWSEVETTSLIEKEAIKS